MSKNNGYEKNTAENGDIIAKNGKKAFEGLTAAFDIARKNILPKSLSKIATYFLIIALGFLLGFAKLPFEVYPLGIAVICGASEFVIPLAAGVIIGSLFTEDMLLQLLFSLIAFISRFVICKWLFSEKSEKKENSAEKTIWRDVEKSEKTRFTLKNALKILDIKFSESIYIRATLCAIILLSLSVTRIIKGGFVYYDLFAGLFCVLSGILCACLYSLCFDKSRAKTAFFEIGLYSVFVSAVIALSEVYLYSLSLNLVATFFITLYVSKTGGMLRGCVAGMLCGLVCSPILAPLFGICGFIAGMFWTVGSFSAVLVSVVFGAAYGFYIDGIAAFSSLLPELILSGILFLLLSFVALLPKSPKWASPKNAEAIYYGDIREKKEADNSRKIQALSQSFAALSDIFYTISEKLGKPAVYDIKQLCDASWQENCSKCSMYELCWEKEYYSTADAVNKMAKALYENSRIMPSDIEGYMEIRCKNTSKIVSEINYKAAHLFETFTKRDKTEIFAFDYDAMAKILEKHLDENENKYTADKILTERLKKALYAVDASFDDAVVYGKEHKYITIYGMDIKSNDTTAAEIQHICGEVCRQNFSAPEYKISGNTMTTSLYPERKLSIEYAVCGGIKENEKISGDTSGALYDNDDYFYSFICDGMGSGREAAFTSRICKVFLEKMLSAGNSVKITLEMLNNFLRNKNTECFATVDLIKIDTVLGTADFIKCGAAESFIWRKNNIFKIASSTPPIGIMKNISAEVNKFEFFPGDIIVLQSDGASAENNGAGILLDIIKNCEVDDVQILAKTIFAAAEKMNKRSDDITVCVIKIS